MSCKIKLYQYLCSTSFFSNPTCHKSEKSLVLHILGQREQVSPFLATSLTSVVNTFSADDHLSFSGFSSSKMVSYPQSYRYFCVKWCFADRRYSSRHFLVSHALVYYGFLCSPFILRQATTSKKYFPTILSSSRSRGCESIAKTTCMEERRLYSPRTFNCIRTICAQYLNECLFFL